MTISRRGPKFPARSRAWTATTRSPGASSASTGIWKQNCRVLFELINAKSPNWLRVHALVPVVTKENLQAMSCRALRTAGARLMQRFISVGDKSGVQSIQGGLNPGTPPGGMNGEPSQIAVLPLPKFAAPRSCRDGRVLLWKIGETWLFTCTPSLPALTNDCPSRVSTTNKNRPEVV